MHFRFRAALAAAAALAAPALAPAAASAAEATMTVGDLALEPCTLSAQGIAATVEAHCTTVSVPENRAEPDGRRIELAVAVVSGDNVPEPDPVFFLAGGPGQAAREAYPQLHAVFREVIKNRLVVLVDQRGTGASHPLACEEIQDDAAAVGGEELATPDAARRAAARCRDALADDADLRFYTTTDAVQDLEAVREAMRAPALNLVGVSYGTRVAQQYLRSHPGRVRSMVLDGVVPNTLLLGSEHARNLEDALAQQFAGCEKVAACRDELGSPRAHLDMLRARLLDERVAVDYRDPQTALPREEQLALAHLQTVVRMYAYQPVTAAMLPLVLSEAAAGRYGPLAAQARMMADQLGDAIMHGMQLSVTCTEDIGDAPADPGDAATLLGDTLTSYLAAQCGEWPRGSMPRDFHDAVSSDVPSLLLSGEYDPVTPPRYGEAVLAGLAHGRHLVLAGQGHNVLPVGCTPRLLARFVETADAEALDAGCLAGLAPAPPFAGFYGWEP
ncbi:alpha/beta fold hydrolase [Coralloluteibacterium stylophorae]|uniref:Alpha/beta fold hydrolase n=1 Tax=Coralloluteibacterium stylophorae TaxID=1776034 RepID=A0A8J7VWD9_9GAMM|nr:alpha/beta fold hydrolase [Coralloluteibacterium stylophorae]MBS7458969.1 alpha/beta fold hydrolase [Coralloluteibacterium stylophorae]